MEKELQCNYIVYFKYRALFYILDLNIDWFKLAQTCLSFISI